LGVVTDKDRVSWQGIEGQLPEATEVAEVQALEHDGGGVDPNGAGLSIEAAPAGLE
jgi:hypothetical protein